MRCSPRSLAVVVLVGVGAQLVIVPVLSAPLRWVMPDADLSSAAQDLTARASGAGMILLAVAVIVGSPIAEEVFFRGLAQRVACTHLGAGLGVAVASAAFAFTHFQVSQIVGLLAAGACFGLLAWRTQSLGPAIAAHAAFNATALLALAR